MCIFQLIIHEKFTLYLLYCFKNIMNGPIAILILLYLFHNRYNVVNVPTWIIFFLLQKTLNFMILLVFDNFCLTIRLFLC